MNRLQSLEKKDRKQFMHISSPHYILLKRNWRLYLDIYVGYVTWQPSNMQYCNTQVQAGLDFDLYAYVYIICNKSYHILVKTHHTAEKISWLTSPIHNDFDMFSTL